MCPLGPQKLILYQGDVLGVVGAVSLSKLCYKQLRGGPA